jgi:hypothetical protein
MATRTYLKRFTDADHADAWMRMKNRAARDGIIYCVVDGPEDDYAVVDLTTAIELGALYTWGR